MALHTSSSIKLFFKKSYLLNESSLPSCNESHFVKDSKIDLRAQMATVEHRHLADIIKKTHATLREEAHNYGAEIAWQRHVTRKDLLQNYATSMQKLATTYWTENNTDLKHCRVEWIKSQCTEYFHNGGKEKYNEREESIKKKINVGGVETSASINVANRLPATRRTTLLDVGSCYNPFGSQDMFDVTAIDLIGLPDTVLQCDFLTVDVGEEKILSNNMREVLQLPENFFDVVVFSLFLEYLPSPDQRYLCCKKAYRLLQPGGVLVIASPDSKHVNANANLMKSWRYVLSKLGFMRVKYEKLRHIHCLVFRKCVFKSVALRWADLQTLPENDPLYSRDSAIYIPQDFRNTSPERGEREAEKYSEVELISTFGELPFAGD